MAGPTPNGPSLKLIRSVGCWAFVSVPDFEPSLPCVVHFWHRRTLDPAVVARVLAHELGHISDGGPKAWLIGDDAEEERAEEFARTTQTVVEFLIREGILIRGR